MEFKDYYKILGVKKNASEKDIRTAYRKLAREFHPDLNPGKKESEARFKEVNEANDVLSDPEKRKKYDLLGSNWSKYEQTQRPGSGRASGIPVDFDDLFGSARARANGGRRGGAAQPGGSSTYEEVFRSDGAGGGSVSDFFETFFSGRGATESPSTSRTRGGSRQGHDVVQDVDISLEEAFNGTTRVIEMTDERGKSRRLEVKVPAGVSNGSRIRIAGQGAPGVLGGVAGDFYLNVRITPSPLFSVEGNDLRVKVSLKLTTALLGGEVDVPTPKGSSLALKVPPETQDGRVFRLRGQGMPKPEQLTERGDLFAEVHIQIPVKLTARQRELIEEFSELERAAPTTAG